MNTRVIFQNKIVHDIGKYLYNILFLYLCLLYVVNSLKEYSKLLKFSYVFQILRKLKWPLKL